MPKLIWPAAISGFGLRFCGRTAVRRQSSEFLRKAAALRRKLGTPPRGAGDNNISALLPNGRRRRALTKSA